MKNLKFLALIVAVAVLAIFTSRSFNSALGKTNETVQALAPCHLEVEYWKKLNR